MRPITVTVGNQLIAGNATTIRTATTAPAGSLVLNGGVVSGGIAILDIDRNVLFTFAAAELGLRLQLQGSNVRGDTVSETIYGPVGAGTILSANQYFKVTSIVSNQNSVGAISIGTSSIATSRPVCLDPWAWTPIGVQVTVSGTVNYDIEVTSVDPTAPGSGAGVNDMVWIDAPDAALVGKTANASGQLAVPWAFARIMLNSGTGSVVATFTQPGVVNR